MVTPDKTCDLVMKGGITSGVVYPAALTELAKMYRFKNIGGTSAGAIAAVVAAAVVAAAAEVGRESGGFDRMAALPGELSAGLLDKFQPVPQLAPLFRLGLAVMSKKMGAIAAAIVSEYGSALAISVLPGLIILVVAIACGWWGLSLSGLLVTILGAIAGPAIAIAGQVSKGLPEHDYGMCSGTTQPNNSKQGLTDWLADTIDAVAGRDPAGPPLGMADITAAGLCVRTVTTDLSTHRPYSLPMDQNLHFFHKSEFLRLFPQRVVEHMISNSAPVDALGDDYYYFQMADLPLVVMARMSLSFPFLFSAVPLWRYDYSLVDNGKRGRLVRCLFSDGGLSSNFPVHFFDTFLPQTPTFGISLGQYDEARVEPGEDKARRVVLPMAATNGQLLPTQGFTGVLDFLMAMFDSAKDWQDNLQSVLPGYRERIVTINLTEDEGGLNLAMPADRIELLSNLGQEAGAEIVTDFKIDEHRWRRYLVEVRAVDEMLRQFGASYHGAPQPGASSYSDIALHYKQDSFRELKVKHREIIHHKAELIAALGQTLADLPPMDDFDALLPKSRSRIRNIARMGN